MCPLHFHRAALLVLGLAPKRRLSSGGVIRKDRGGFR